jgi:hypothetical protein
MSDDPISDALGVEPTKKNPIEIKTNNTEPVASTFDQRKKDYQMVRDNLKHIIETSSVAIDGILNVASEGESPRAYEVVSQLIKTTLEANESLVDLHKKIKDIEKNDEEKEVQATHVTNNALYVGSTKDLLQMIKKDREQLVLDAEIVENEQAGE